MKKIFAFLLLAASLSTLAGDRPVPCGTNTIYLPGFRTYTASGCAPSESNIEDGFDFSLVGVANGPCTPR